MTRGSMCPGGVRRSGPVFGRGSYDPRFGERLAQFLLGLVPIYIHDMRDWAPDQFHRAKRATGEKLHVHGDDLVYGGKHATKARTALAMAIALGAYAEGGITACGVHACVRSHPVWRAA